jgi:hypothetical protein
MRHENTRDSTQQKSPKHAKTRKIKSESPAKRAKTTKCTCKCQCGFYSQDMDLVAATPSHVQQYSPDINYSNPCSSSTTHAYSPAGFSPNVDQKFAIMSVDDQFLLSVSFFQQYKRLYYSL